MERSKKHSVGVTDGKQLKDRQNPLKEIQYWRSLRDENARRDDNKRREDDKRR